MIPKWYIIKDRKKLGPFSAGELRNMANSGRLLTTDMVQKEDSPKPLPASALKGLFVTDETPAVPQDQASSSSHHSRPRGSRFVLIVAALLAFLGLAGAGWFFVQSQGYQTRLEEAEGKLRNHAAPNVPTTPHAEKPPATTDERKKLQAAAAQEAQLRGSLHELEEKSAKDAAALKALHEKVAQLQARTQVDAEALNGLQASLRDFRLDVMQRFDKQITQRIDELDKKHLLQGETLAALRKKLGFPDFDQVPRELIDKYALAAGPEAEKSVDALARYLSAPFRTDTEKVRAIYRWIADRIDYDVPALLGKDHSKQSPGDVLVSRKAVCMGYANLFEKLCRLNDLDVAIISGEAGSAPGLPPGPTSHSWNAVKVQDRWQLIDVTWGAGSTNNNVFQKKLNEVYFLAPPELMVLGHFPNEPKWQLLEPPLSEQDIRLLFALPRLALTKIYEAGAKEKALLHQALKNESFRASVKRLSNPQINTLERLGLLSGQAMLEALSQENFAGLVTAGIPPGMDSLTVHQAPLSKELQAGTTLSIELSGPKIERAAIIMNGKFFHMTSKGNHFTGSVVLQPGDVKVGVLPQGQSNVYQNILVYAAVETNKGKK